MALEDTIKEEFERFIQAKNLADALTDPKQQYDPDLRQKLGQMKEEDDPTFDPMYYMATDTSNPLFLAVPDAERLSGDRAKAYLEGAIDKNFKAALDLVPEETLISILYSISPKEDSDLANKIKKYQKLGKLINDQKASPDKKIKAYIDEAKKESTKESLVRGKMMDPQRVINSFGKYIGKIEAEIGREFQNEEGEWNYNSIKEYIARNISLTDPKERTATYFDVGRAIFEKE